MRGALDAVEARDLKYLFHYLVDLALECLRAGRQQFADRGGVVTTLGRDEPDRVARRHLQVIRLIDHAARSASGEHFYFMDFGICRGAQQHCSEQQGAGNYTHGGLSIDESGGA
ncbi:hypothetical protein D3C81_1103420 [compost metagenome]